MVKSRLPNIEKSWQTSVNNVAAKQETELVNNQKTLFTIKEKLVNFSRNPWTVVRSSDSVSATAADTWLNYTDIVWSSGNYSWIVLKKPTTGSQLLIDCERSTSRDLRMYWSPGGNYVGGSITTKPTATDEVTLQLSGNWNGNLSVFTSWVHVWHSEDGALTRIVVTNDQQDPSLLWILDEVENVFPDNWSHPEIVGIYEGILATSRDAISVSPVMTNAAKGYQNGVGAFDITLGCMGNDSQASGYAGTSWMTEQFYGSVGNEIDINAAYPLAPVIITSDTVGARGVHGYLVDVWWGHQDRPIGTTYPDSVTLKEMIQFEHIVLPWTGGSDVPLVDAPGFNTTMPDESGNGNDATLTNMEYLDVVSDTSGGVFSENALLFDGVNEYAVIGDVAELQFEFDNEFSISAWVKTSSSATMGVFTKLDSSSPNTGYELLMIGGKFVLELINSLFSVSYIRVDTTSTFHNNTWHHVVATYDGSSDASGVTLYVDNVVQSVTVVTNTLSGSIATTTPAQIGARDGSTILFNGYIDDVAVYNKELTSGEVSTIYNGGQPNDLRTNGPDGYLAGYWLMGEGLVTIPEYTDPGMYIGYGASLPNAVETINYVMVGIDSGAPDGLFPAYHYWTVQGSPDIIGAQAGTLQYGGPLINIRVSAEYSTITKA